MVNLGKGNFTVTASVALKPRVVIQVYVGAPRQCRARVALLYVTPWQWLVQRVAMASLVQE